MKSVRTFSFLFLLAVVITFLSGANGGGCDTGSEPVSSTGVHKATAAIMAGSDGLTVEQRNIMSRLALENSPGSIKHLYILSAYSGQCILYSTVRDKVTSSEKRLTPYTITDTYSTNGVGFALTIGDYTAWTQEVLQDDGTYGDSVPYLFWWDVQGRYHQHYVSGGQIVHISDQPIPVKSVTLNLEIIE